MTVTLKVITECDKCLSDTGGDIHNEATFTLVYQIGDDAESKRLRVDLCGDHTNIATLTDILKIGNPWVPDAELQGPPLSRRGRDLAVCVHCGKEYKAGSGMSLHIKSKHPEAWEPGPAALAVREAKRKKKGK